MPESRIFIWSIVRSDDRVTHPRLPLPLLISRHPRARSLKLRLDVLAGVLRLTCPPRVARSAALRWAGEQGPWVEQQLASRAPAIPFVHGSIIPFDGAQLKLFWVESQPRQAQRHGDRIVVGGPYSGFARRVETWLRKEAQTVLSADTREVAASAGVLVTSVSIGDPVSRWGSCSAEGSIRYSWRLIMAPPEVRRAVVAHEVAHRVHMNHGPEFRTLEAALFDGNLKQASALLRKLGRSLHLIGRPA